MDEMHVNPILPLGFGLTYRDAYGISLRDAGHE